MLCRLSSTAADRLVRKFLSLEDFFPSLPNSEQPNILEPILFDWVNDYATVCSDYFHLLVQGKVHLRSWTMDLDLVQLQHSQFKSPIGYFVFSFVVT